MVNYYCTGNPSSSSQNPTLWFEGSAAHGTVDFLGIQTILHDNYGRSSCSYDPPNFGWSERLPSSVSNYYDYFTPLLQATGRLQEPRVLVGWGGGGNNVLMHAQEHPNTTTAIVLLDVSPDGIEFLDAQRVNNWTTPETLKYGEDTLRGRAALAQAVLGICITWFVNFLYEKSMSLLIVP